ncbi:hypothetical protein C8Q72DRAFT_775580 [Fomitopsis betulina]|nr:hypothetical protein C8Q72DRAFT_775580 [Fomitopsis betulina]
MVADPGKSTASLLDPPAPCSLRSPRPDLLYPPFEPTSLRSLSDDLWQGFPPLPPQSRDAPHPFATHDVAEEDWRVFVFNVKEVGLLGIGLYLDNLFLWCLLKRGVVGLGALVSMGFQHATKGKRAGAVGDIVDQWNMSFFHRRQMTVVLARGYNGPDGVGPPDMMTTPVDGRWRLVIAYRLEHGF